LKEAHAKYRALVVEESFEIKSGASKMYMPCKADQCDSGCKDRSCGDDCIELKCATGFSDDSAEVKANRPSTCVNASVCGTTYKGSAGTVVCNAINMVMTAVSALALLTQM